VGVRRERLSGVGHLNKKALSILLVILLFNIVAMFDVGLIVRVNPAQAQLVPNMSINPPETKDPLLTVGQEFTVDINITNVENLFGWQAQIFFNLDAVNCTARSKIVQGPFLTDWFGSAYVSYSRSINYQEGYLLVAASKIPPYEGFGASGNGTLASVTFTVVGNNRATLLQFGPESYLRSVSGDPPQLVFIEPFTTDDGVFDNRSPGTNTPPVASFTILPLDIGFRGRIRFNTTASYDPDAWIAKQHWDFGDGTTAVYMRERLRNINLTNTPTHVYTQNGTFTATLTVEDSDGLTAGAASQATVVFDVAVTYVESPFVFVMPGTMATVDVTVVNHGYFSEDCNVTAYGNSTKIGTVLTTSLDPMEERVVTIKWDTTGIDYGKYYLKANTSVAGEENLSDNEYTDGFVIATEVNIINYPVNVGGVIFSVGFESTSGISAFRYNVIQKKMTFNVTGELGWFCNVSIPMVLLNVSSPDAWIVNLNGTDITYTSTENSTHHFVYFNYTQSFDSRPVHIIGETGATPPTALFTVSKTTALIGEDISFDASTSYDSDGTIDSWSWNFGDGETGTGQTTTHSYSTIGDYETRLTVTDNEGYANSTTITITVVTHDIAIIGLTAAPSTVRIGETIAIQVTIENQGNFTETFTVTVYRNSTTIETHTVTNMINGSSQVLTTAWNTAGAGVGTYTIKAETSAISGETDTLDNNRTGVMVTLQKQLSSLTIASSSTTVTVGDDATITGTLTPTQQGKEITLQYRLVGQSWGTYDTATTDAQGDYEFVWTPDAAGTYELQTTWQGDASTESSQSSIQTVIVDEAGGFSIPIEYVVGGIAAVIILIAVAVYLIKIRK
jgi:PKD repeat protein